MKKRKKKASTRAGKYVEEEIHHMKTGKHQKTHPIKSRKQAIAIGLSKARQKGIPVPKNAS
jgi:uncharacterized protein DUF6496